MRVEALAAACAGLVLAASSATWAEADSSPAPSSPRGLSPSDSPRFATTDSLTLAGVIARARDVAPDVRAARLDLDAARLDSAATSRNRRPNFSLVGGALVVPRGYYDPVETNLGEYNLKARAEWPLADGGARSRERRRSVIEAGRAGAESGRTSRDAAVDAANAAVGILRLEDSESIRVLTLAWIEHLARQIGAGIRGGAHGRGDEQRVLLARDAVTADLLSTRQDLATTRRELGKFIGWSGEDGPLLKAPDEAEDRGPAESDSLALVRAIVHSPEIRAAELDLAERALDVEEARRKSALEFDLAADAGLWGSDLTHVVPEDLRATHPGATFEDRLHRDLGASVSFDFKKPVLDASVRPRVEARRANQTAASVRAESAHLERERFARDLLTRWRVASQKLEISRGSTARAQQHVLRLESLYSGGAATLLELLDARDALDDALEREADARADLRRARSEAEAQP
ncbi:MAG TPA: TolC family protein [Candidatus Udaeobacter sp.]|jgi:outer membrane protein TolC|nr:TolC family protein [Candidatus Udaeobacter sp.]